MLSTLATCHPTSTWSFPSHGIEECNTKQEGGTCGTDGREEERVKVIGRKETTRKTET
jgi:hypothetical protein